MTHELRGLRVFELPAEGPKIRAARDAIDAISEALAQSAQWLAIPVARLDDDFFRLSTGVAGDIIPKFATYGMRAAFVGDVSQYMSNSDSFRDFVREANRGKDLCFVANLDDLNERLAQVQSRSAIREARP